MTGAGQTAWMELHEVSLVRGGRLLFADLSLRLDAGGALLVTGPNGAGKSSLLRLMAGLLRPTAGRVGHAGGIALAATEAAALDPALTLGAALGFWGGIDGVTPPALAAASEAMGIAHLSPVPVVMLSTGQRRRATLARVIADGAPIWLLDEPANGLDASAREALEAALARHRAGGGIAVVATHQRLALDGARELML